MEPQAGEPASRTDKNRTARKVRTVEGRGKVRISHALDEVEFDENDPVWTYVEDGRIVIDHIEKP